MNIWQTETVNIAGRAAILLLAAIAQASCNSIDDDLSDCGRDVPVVYTVRQLANLDAVLANELSDANEQPVAQQLRKLLTLFFTQQVHLLNRAFYADATPYLSEQSIMDAQQATFITYLRDNSYRHLAVGTIASDPVISIIGSDTPTTYLLQQGYAADTIDSHSDALFTARSNLDIDNSTAEKTFGVDLYQQNSAVALVLDPVGVQFPAIRACLTGLASSFAINDSTYSYATSRPVRMQPVDVVGSPFITLCGRAFPSVDTAPAATRTNATATEAEAIWQLHAYVTRPDGTVTENRLFIPTPLKADQLRIIKGVILPDGTIVPSLQEVGVSVTLDWHQGGIYNPSL